MQKISKILVPFDFSENSRQALQMGIALGLKYDSSLMILSVIERTPEDEISKLMTLPNNVEKKLKEKIIAEIHSSVSKENLAKINIQAFVQKGKAGVEILLMAEQEKVDLVVMGTHGRTGLKHMLMGSVAEKVVHRAGAPVLIHRQEASPLPRKILIPVDFSEYCRDAVKVGLHWANDFGAEPYFLHVVDLRDLYTFDLLSIKADRPSIETALKKQAEERLTEWTHAIKPAHHLEIRLGDPSLEIQGAIKDHSIDLVVMATHGRTGLKHMLLGSVAEKTVRHSPCSVLTLRSPVFVTKIFEGEEALEGYMKSFRD
jgi:nucleotide-binding universal stress UspA family protein